MKHTKRCGVLFAVVMLFTLTACGEDTTTDAELLQLGSYELRYKGASIMEDPDGKDALVLTLDFTNHGEDSRSYVWSITETAMQKGTELEVAAVFTGSDTYDTVIDSQFTDVAPGATLEIKTSFVLADTTSKVEVTFEEVFGDKSGKITVDPSVLSRETGGAAQPAGAGNQQLDWWKGDWYGWWMMTDCAGCYEDMEGDWWDICGTIALDADSMGTVTLWDEDYTKSDPMVSASVSFSDAGTSAQGTMTSEGGFFTDIALEDGDWIVDPGLVDHEDMLHIEGDYANGDDAFRYDIYLRPWGTAWDDMDKEDRPDRYDDWYLPLVEQGQAMPARIGAGAEG